MTRDNDDGGMESGSEDELFLAEKDWKKMHARSLTNGYREGVGQAAEEGLQTVFDEAYVGGFRRGVELGKIRGRIAAKKFLNNDKPEIVAELDSLELQLNSMENSFRSSPNNLQLSESMESFDVRTPVFRDPEVCKQFLASLNLYSQTCVADSEEAWKWLRTPPLETIVRVNTLKCSREELIEKLRLFLRESHQDFTVQSHEVYKDVVVIQAASNDWSNDDHSDESKEYDGYVVVGEMCGLAVMRGAEVYVPGILCISPPDLRRGARVRILADVRAKCLRGAKTFAGEVRQVGAGQLRVARDEVFGPAGAAGVGVAVTKKVFPCPSLNHPELAGLLMLQNLPSIIAVEVLDPRPGETVLDMCAAPGGKTTHIAARMENTGRVVALDKSENKTRAIQRNCAQLGATIVTTFAADGSKCVETADCAPGSSDSGLAPPFPEESFDRVLVDAPCSGLGQRPQFYNKMSSKELRSFPRIQRKLLSSAVRLLRPGGVLLYSTCTNNVEEDGELVTWAADTFPCLHLEQTQHYGHPASHIDTITFFWAKFTKIKS